MICPIAEGAYWLGGVLTLSMMTVALAWIWYRYQDARLNHEQRIERAKIDYRYGDGILSDGGDDE